MLKVSSADKLADLSGERRAAPKPVPTVPAVPAAPAEPSRVELALASMARHIEHVATMAAQASQEAAAASIAAAKRQGGHIEADFIRDDQGRIVRAVMRKVED